MLRAAAKNHERVTVLVDPADYAPVLAELRTGAVTEATRRRLAARAFGHTARYDANRFRLAAAAAGRYDLPGCFRCGIQQEAGSALRRESAPIGRVLCRPARGGRFHRDSPAVAGQGAFLQQHRGCRHRDRVRAAVRFAGLRDRQACESLRRCDRGRCARGLPSRLGAGHHIRIRRNHRFQPATRCTCGRRNRRTPVRRSDRGTVLRTWCARGARREAECPRAGNRADPGQLSRRVRTQVRSRRPARAVARRRHRR